MSTLFDYDKNAGPRLVAIAANEALTKEERIEAIIDLGNTWDRAAIMPLTLIQMITSDHDINREIRASIDQIMSVNDMQVLPDRTVQPIHLNSTPEPRNQEGNEITNMYGLGAH